MGPLLAKAIPNKALSKRAPSKKTILFKLSQNPQLLSSIFAYDKIKLRMSGKAVFVESEGKGFDFNVRRRPQVYALATFHNVLGLKKARPGLHRKETPDGPRHSRI